MAQVDESLRTRIPGIAREIPSPVLWILRGVGQVFFQENALTGGLFLLGIAVSSPIMALGGLVGAAIGTAVAILLKFDEKEIAAGLYGFNAALVGIATPFFFRPGAMSVVLLVAGSAVAALSTRMARRFLPFPTYTAPFIVVTWALYFLGLAIGVAPVNPGGPPVGVGPLVATAHGVSQVMFQASIWTALFFLAGIAINDWKHALLVLIGSTVGMLLGTYVAAVAARGLDPERLVDRSLLENVALGLYGYNATLAAVAVFLSKPSLIPTLLGIFLSVLVTELFPSLGLPALTAPFVLATWIVLALSFVERTIFPAAVSPPP